MRVKLIILLSLVFQLELLTPSLAQVSFSTANVTLKVVDEEGNAVEGANVRICFYGGCQKKDALKGMTDGKGLFIASSRSRDGQVGGAVEKSGYYTSTYHYDFYRNILGIWQPSNAEIKITLRPKINPVPMYVRNRLIEIPFIDKEIGFDLIKFDWVIPYGQGMQSDLIFHLDRKYKNPHDYEATLTITFPNKYDGIQELTVDRGGDFSVGSEFRLPRYAPEAGYQQKVVRSVSTRSPDFLALREDYKAFFFRVRSEIDEHGNLKRAMYGKITKDIEIDPTHSKTSLIRFTYYLNPDHTRNLEFDGDRNLFNPLPSYEIPLKMP